MEQAGICVMIKVPLGNPPAFMTSEVHIPDSQCFHLSFASARPMESSGCKFCAVFKGPFLHLLKCRLWKSSTCFGSSSPNLLPMLPVKATKNWLESQLVMSRTRPTKWKISHIKLDILCFNEPSLLILARI